MAEETPAQGPELVISEALRRKRAVAEALKAKTTEPPVSGAPRPNGAAATAVTAHTTPTADIAVTWASTDPLERIGKIWRAAGKWPVTSGVRSAAYRFKRTTHASLEDFAKSLMAHMKSGAFAIVSGAPNDITKATARDSDNFTDEPCCRLELDFDGFKAADGQAPRSPR